MKKRLFNCLILGGVLCLGLGVMTSCKPSDDNVTTPTLYNITLKNVTGVDYKVSKTSAESGETITITINSVDNGYKVEEVSVSGGVTVTKVNDNTYTFLMPAMNVEVSITTSTYEITRTLTVNNLTTGTISIMNQPGELFNLDSNNQIELNENSIYYLSVEFRNTDANKDRLLSFYINDVEVTEGVLGNMLTFTMETEDLTIKIDYKEEVITGHKISIEYDSSLFEPVSFMKINSLEDPGEPTTISDLENVKAGTHIVFGLYPYNEGTITVTLNDSLLNIYQDFGMYYFQMPDNDVSIKVAFEETSTKYGITLVSNDTDALSSISKSLFDLSGDTPTQVGLNERFVTGTKLGLMLEIPPIYEDKYIINSVKIGETTLTSDENGYYQFIVEESDITINIDLTVYYSITLDLSEASSFTSDDISFVFFDETSTSADKVLGGSNVVMMLNYEKDFSNVTFLFNDIETLVSGTTYQFSMPNNNLTIKLVEEEAQVFRIENLTGLTVYDQTIGDSFLEDNNPIYLDSNLSREITEGKTYELWYSIASMPEIVVTYTGIDEPLINDYSTSTGYSTFKFIAGSESVVLTIALA